MNYSYRLENLNCAHCASKIENTIAKTEGYKNVSLNFATKKLNFTFEKQNPLNEIAKICNSIEKDVVVIDSTAGAVDATNKKENAIKNTTNENKEHFTSANLKKANLKKSAKLYKLAISVALTVASLFMHLLAGAQPWSFWIAMLFCFISILLVGTDIFLKGIKNIFKLKIDEITLMSIAVASAFCLGEFFEASMVIILFSIGELLEEKALNTSRRDIEKLAQIRPDFATVIVDGEEKRIPAEEVSVGSIIVVKPYERVPLDGVIISGTTTFDISALTGESIPVDASKGSECMSGAINGNGLIEIKTTKKFSESTATRILRLVEDAAAQKSKREKLISRFASVYTPIVIAIALIVAFVPFLMGFGELKDWIYRALTCLVASCPCAIVISVPLAYYSGIGAGSKIGVLIKGGKYLEALAKADVFVFDKTGTLTTGQLNVTDITSLSDYSKEDILTLSATCEKHSKHPVAEAIKRKAEGLNLPKLTDYKERAGFGASAIYKGKLLQCGGAKIIADSQKEKSDKAASVFLVYDGKLIGTISVSDTIRKEAKSVVENLKKSGIKKTYMLTGDINSTAESIKNELSIDCFTAELLPDEKLKAIEDIKQTYNTVCFVGDGINDAPVLSASDCGIAMGLGSEIAIEASDVVLASGSLDALPKAVKLAKKVVNTVKSNIIFALSVKVAVIIMATLGFAPMWLAVVADTGVSVICVLHSSGKHL